MLGVRFTKDMRPWRANDTAMVPEPVARRLMADGDAEAYEFPPAAHSADAGAPASEAERAPSARSRRAAYQTKAQ